VAKVENQYLKLGVQRGLSLPSPSGLGVPCGACTSFPPHGNLGYPHAPALSGQQSFVSRVKMATVPKPWNTPPEVEKKIHLIYQKSEFVEKSMKSFSGRWAWGKRGGTCSLPP